MGKDPAFLFYPGDYLRDTQCMSEVQQVAYDRMMCEHMRNICISKTKLNFFTKKLNQEEKDYLIDLLKEVDGGYQIEWVALSIEKRRAYSESRRKNRDQKKNNICESYDSHMENENENKDIIKDKNETEIEPWYLEQADFWINRAKKYFPSIKVDRNRFASDIERLVKIDKLKIEEIILIQDYLAEKPDTNGFNWFFQIGTPGKLRERSKNVDKIKYWELVLKDIFKEKEKSEPKWSKTYREANRINQEILKNEQK
jgi:hypothetical protein